MSKPAFHADGQKTLKNNPAQQEELIKALGDIELAYQKKISAEPQLWKRLRLKIEMEWALNRMKRALRKDDALFIGKNKSESLLN